jgi:hypothetical protein
MSEKIMKVSRAVEITGGLSDPSKMPMGSYSLPPAACKVGAALRGVEGSVCSRCYARKGRYGFKGCVAATERRLASLGHPEWVAAMSLLIANRAAGTAEAWRRFRWHDSGDLQSEQHFLDVILVARRLPWVWFWLPTMECRIVADALARPGMAVPENMVVRISTPMVDGSPSDTALSLLGEKTGVRLSMVNKGAAPEGVWSCPATRHAAPTCRGNDCSACWSRDLRAVSYGLH